MESNTADDEQTIYMDYPCPATPENYFTFILPEIGELFLVTDC